MTRISDLSLVDDADTRFPQHPRLEAGEQTVDATVTIQREATDFLHFPWAALSDVVGGIGPGEVWFVGAYSGHGKTTFLTSALDCWFEQGKGVYYMGLESQPHVLRTHWACKRLGLDAGEVLSGGLNKRVDGQFIRAQIIRELKSQCEGERPEQIYFSPKQFVDANGLEAAGREANALSSDVLIIDHVDHLQGTGRSLYDQSVASIKRLLHIAQKYELRVLAATQFNNEMIRGNRLGLHSAPTPNVVYMGNHKRQVATGMLGLYRPLRFAGLTADESKAFAKGNLEPQKVIEPNIMAVSVMKHRLHGNREGKRVYLRVEHGKVTDLPESELGPILGIRTRDRDFGA
jgi:KaiC/GvpD/RAD55 family RecA-like ATPase